MVCDDGSVYNDSQSEWCGVTVFAALSYVKALKFHGHLLSAQERKSWVRLYISFAVNQLVYT